MLNWLVTQVNWIIDKVNAAYNWIVSFIQNPYPTIRTLLDWVYDRAVRFVEAVKKEIANWTYGLFQSILSWITFFDNLYNQIIAPAIASIKNLTNNIVNYVSQLVAKTVSDIGAWIGERIEEVKRFANDVWKYLLVKTAEITDWTYKLFAGLLVDIAWLKANIAPFNPREIWKKIEELNTFIVHVDRLIIKIILDSLLDWLEDKLGEALE